MAGKTLSIRINNDRVMLAIEKYKKSEASIEKASKIAGVSISKMMDIFSEYGVQSKIEYDDYLKGFKNLRKIWHESGRCTAGAFS